MRRWRGGAAGRARHRATTASAASPQPGPQVTIWPGRYRAAEPAGRRPEDTPELSRRDPRTSAGRSCGQESPFPGPARRGGGETGRWPPAGPSSPAAWGRRAPRPATCCRGSARGSALGAGTRGLGPAPVPASAPRATRPRPHARRLTRYLRARPACRAAVSHADTRNANLAAEPLRPRSDAVGRDVPRRRAGGAACSCAVAPSPDPRGGGSSKREADADGVEAGGAGWGGRRGGLGGRRGRGRPPPRRGCARGGACASQGSAAGSREPGARSLFRCRHDHPCALLHLRQDCRQQVGGLPGAAAGRVHRGVRRRVGAERPPAPLGSVPGPPRGTHIRSQVPLQGLSVPGSRSALLAGERGPRSVRRGGRLGIKPLASGASRCPGRSRCRSASGPSSACPPPLFLCCQAHPHVLEAHLSFRTEDSFRTTSLSSSGRCRSLFRARPLSLQSTPFLPESLIPTRVTP